MPENKNFMILYLKASPLPPAPFTVARAGLISVLETFGILGGVWFSFCASWGSFASPGDPLRVLGRPSRVCGGPLRFFGGPLRFLRGALGVSGGPLERLGCEGMRWETKLSVLPITSEVLGIIRD